MALEWRCEFVTVGAVDYHSVRLGRGKWQLNEYPVLDHLQSTTHCQIHSIVLGGVYNFTSHYPNSVLSYHSPTQPHLTYIHHS